MAEGELFFLPPSPMMDPRSYLVSSGLLLFNRRVHGLWSIDQLLERKPNPATVKQTHFDVEEAILISCLAMRRYNHMAHRQIGALLVAE